MVCYSKVEAADLQCAEYCYVFRANLTGKPGKKAPEPQKEQWKASRSAELEELHKLGVALANRCGGFVTIENVNRSVVSGTEFEDWQTHFSQKVIEHSMSSTTYDKCFTFVEVGGYLRMIVRPNKEFITYKSHMWIRRGAQTVAVYDGKAISEIRATPASHSKLPTLPKQLLNELRHGDTMSVMEGDNIEFKWIKAKSIGELRDHFNEQAGIRVFRTLLAFGNMDRGGTLFFGVDDKTQKILGQQLEESEEEDFRKLFTQLMEEDLEHLEKRIWGTESRTKGKSPKSGVDWDVQFLPIQHNGTDRKVLIVIRVRKCQGGVFMKESEAFTATDQGDVTNLSFKEWERTLPKVTIASPALPTYYPKPAKKKKVPTATLR